MAAHAACLLVVVINHSRAAAARFGFADADRLYYILQIQTDDDRRQRMDHPARDELVARFIARK
jgi:hypothetical protein